ncbi:AIPR family protein [Candidatus Hepatincola sp. Av]
MSHKIDKKQYQEITKAALKIYQTIENSEQENTPFHKTFPYLILQTFFDDDFIEDRDIQNAIFKLDKHDEGIDSFHINYQNKTINICQFKTTQSHKNDSPPKREWFTDLHGKANQENLISSSNERVKEIANEIIDYKQKGYDVQYYLFYTSNKKAMNPYPNDINYYNLDDIYNQLNIYNSKLDLTDPETCTLEFEAPSNKKNDEQIKEINYYSPRSEKRYKTSIGLVSGYSLIELYKTHQEKLFDRNVRFFLGKKGVNKEIIKTAQDKPKLFYYYNNGITFICKEMDKKGLTLTLTRPQIINGSQTVHSLYEAYKTFPREKDINSNFKEIKVLVRVLEAPKEETDFGDNLTKYTNSNNKVKLSDYKANSKEQENLQKNMYKLNYYYIIKRGEDKYFLNPKHPKHPVINDYKYIDIFRKQKIYMEKLAQIYCAYKLNMQHIATNSPSDIFSDLDSTIYNQLFVSNINLFETKKMIFSYLLFKDLEEIAKKGKSFTENKKMKKDKEKIEQCFNSAFDKYLENDKEDFNNFLKYVTEGKYLILSAIGYLITKNNLEEHLEKNYESQSTITQIRKDWLYYILRLIDKCKKPNIIFKNYIKKKEAWENLQKEIDRLSREELRQYILSK